RPLVEKAKIAGQPIPALLDLLKSYEDRTRYRTRRELRDRDRAEVLSAVKTWLDAQKKDDPEYWHHMLEGLWLHQPHATGNTPLLETMLTCPEPRARAAAVRVLCYWRDRVDNPLERLRKGVNDEHSRVRLEAIRALSFYDGADASQA